MDLTTDNSFIDKKLKISQATLKVSILEIHDFNAKIKLKNSKSELYVPLKDIDMIEETSTQPQDKCECGHARSQHVYERGACRPGFVCSSRCPEFNLKV